MKLSVGPILYLWDRATVLAFYESLCSAPIDIVYLGEVVCSKRRLLHKEDWPRVIEMLREAGKEVVISTLALAEAESELAMLARHVEGAGGLVEANDYACVECVSGRAFVAGPHLNVHNEATLRLLSRKGAQRWVAPVELPLAIVAALAELRPANMEVEMFAYGRLPLDFSARCFTQSAAVHNLLPHIHKLRNAGVDVLRLSPHSRDFGAVIEAFHDALRGGINAALTAPYRMVQPSGEGAVRCMQQALTHVTSPIQYLNTHGTSTPLGDVLELQAVREVFGDDLPLISSTKSLSGHSLGAAGVHEAIYSLLMMRDGFVAGSANIEQLDPACSTIRSCGRRSGNRSTR